MVGAAADARRGDARGWEFDIRTGKSWCGLRPYPVSVRPGTELAEGPYVAESFPVRIEDKYVVVDA